MGNVTIQVGGRAYSLACQDGQEAHLASLGQLIDSKLASVDTAVTQNEPRTLLFAAVLLADELHELRNRPAPVPAPAPTDDGASAAPDLEALAARLEKLATSLEA